MGQPPNNQLPMDDQSYPNEVNMFYSSNRWTRAVNVWTIIFFDLLATNQPTWIINQCYRDSEPPWLPTVADRHS